jgi:hypothetical protein
MCNNAAIEDVVDYWRARYQESSGATEIDPSEAMSSAADFRTLSRKWAMPRADLPYLKVYLSVRAMKQEIKAKDQIIATNERLIKRAACRLRRLQKYYADILRAQLNGIALDHRDETRFSGSKELCHGAGHNEIRASRTLDEAAVYWMLKCILSEQPIVSSSFASDYERICGLRTWLYHNTLLASPETVFPAEVTKELTAMIIYRMAQKQGRLMCGGITKLFNDLCTSFGFFACSYNMGLKYWNGTQINGTHVVSIVFLEHDGVHTNCVQDATFGYSLETLRRSPLSYDCVIDLLLAGKFDDVLINEHHGLRNWIAKRMTPVSRYEIEQRDYSFPGLARHDGYGGWLEELMGNRNPLNLYLFPLGLFPAVPSLESSFTKASHFRDTMQISGHDRIKFSAIESVNIWRRLLALKNAELEATNISLANLNDRVVRLASVCTNLNSVASVVRAE